MNGWKVMLSPEEKFNTPSVPKVILYWTKFFILDDFAVGMGNLPFISCNKTCFTTNDRKFINQSDAIIFHARDLNPDDLPPASWRLPHQVYVFFLLESPIHTDLDLLRKYFVGYFNLTMTYRRDSDIVSFQSGRIKCLDETLTNWQKESVVYDFRKPCSLSVSSQPAHLQKSLERILIKKNQTIAWFVSNCWANSRREALVESLAQYIKVDIYGNCPGSHECQNRTACDQMLSDHYHFYLSFENSLCPDYITEKLYRALAYNTVPIVYGGADYTKYLPDGSYINVLEFNSTLDLANYLRKIIEDKKLYSKFFRWKSLYTLDKTSRYIAWCNLCEYIQLPREAKVYDDIAKWWSGEFENLSCSPPPEPLVPPEKWNNFDTYNSPPMLTLM